MLLAITKFELQDIRKALLSANKREEGYQQKLSDGLRVINAILDKKVEVVPATDNPTEEEPDPWEIGEFDIFLAGTVEIDEEDEVISHGC